VNNLQEIKILLTDMNHGINHFEEDMTYLYQKLTEDSMGTAKISEKFSGNMSLKIKEEDPEDEQDSESSPASEQEKARRGNPGDPEVPSLSEDGSDDEEDKDSRRPRSKNEAKRRPRDAPRADALRRKKPFRYILKLPKFKDGLLITSQRG